MVTIHPNEFGAPETVQTRQWWEDQGQFIGHDQIVNPMARRRYAEFVNVHVGNPSGCDTCDGLWGHNGRWYKLSAFPQPVPAGFLITPAHIDCKESGGTFGQNAVEQEATALLHFAQKVGCWRTFNPENVRVSEDALDWFVKFGFLVKKEDGLYGYTMGFVYEFYAMYPAK